MTASQYNRCTFQFSSRQEQKLERDINKQMYLYMHTWGQVYLCTHLATASSLQRDWNCASVFCFIVCVRWTPQLLFGYVLVVCIALNSNLHEELWRLKNSYTWYQNVPAERMFKRDTTINCKSELCHEIYSVLCGGTLFENDHNMFYVMHNVVNFGMTANC